MRATDILSAEHRVIERVMDALETAAKRVEDGATVRPVFFLDASDFIQHYADHFHHMKEEDVLFEVMAANGFPKEGGPIAVMLAEHDEGRGYNRAMRAAGEKWAAGDSSSRGNVTRNAHAFVDMLRPHIQKEDNILYVMAAKVIPPDQQEQMAETFDRITRQEEAAGLPQRYLALAAELEAEMKG